MTTVTVPSVAPAAPEKPAATSHTLVIVLIVLAMAGIGLAAWAGGTAAPASPEAPATSKASASWTGAPTVQAIAADSFRISDAAKAGDLLGVRAACRQGETDARTAQAAAPLPVAAADAAWQKSLGHFLESMTACQDGIRQGDPTMLSRSAELLGLSTGETKQAAAILGG